ncbi:MAG: phosphatidylglycerol lysyltransferase domain-containing protein [Thermomicrobiales bacterium]
MGATGEATAEQARSIILRHGYNTNAYVTLLPPPFSYFTAADIDGVIAYQQYGNVWLCGGDPICAEPDIVPLTAAFQRAARRAKRTIAFLPATPRATMLLTDRLGFDYVKVGEDNFYDLQTWSARGQKMKHIRANINRATREGVLVRRCEPDDLTDALRARVRQLIATWLTTRGMAALSFLLGIHPFERMEDRRLFLAWQGERVVGLLACSPIPARNGWYLEDIIRDDAAPVGVTELLFQETVAALRAEGAACATLGMAALADCGPAHQPPTHRLAGWAFATLYTRLNTFYHFQSLRFYKEKFGPTATEETFFTWWPRGLRRPRLIFAITRALDPEGIPATLLSPIKQSLTRRGANRLNRRDAENAEREERKRVED